MTVREQLIRELEQTPDALIEQILTYCLFLKQRYQVQISEKSKQENLQNEG